MQSGLQCGRSRSVERGVYLPHAPYFPENLLSQAAHERRLAKKPPELTTIELGVTKSPKTKAAVRRLYQKWGRGGEGREWSTSLPLPTCLTQHHPSLTHVGNIVPSCKVCPPVCAAWRSLARRAERLISPPSPPSTTDLAMAPYPALHHPACLQPRVEEDL